MPVEDLLATPTLTHRDMPFVAFKTEAVEDPVRTKADGVMRFKDQDYAVITVPGDTKANSIEKVESFFVKKEAERQAGRVHPEWIVRWRKEYDLYKQGLEIPVNGTPIKGWKLLSNAQQEELVRMHIRTVEELADMNADAMRHFGMGAQEYKRRAQSWLAQNQTHETGALQLNALQRENDSLKSQVETLMEKMAELERALPKKGKPSGV